MKVVLLAGGLGTRFGKLTEVLPKPMIPVGGRPILHHIMRIYAHYGHREFILCLGYKAEAIKHYFLNLAYFHNDLTLRTDGRRTSDVEILPSADDIGDWKITLAFTGENSMTGARVRRIEKYLEGEDFLLTYGDGVADLDLHKLVAFHREHGRIGTLTAVHPPPRFGNLKIEGTSVTEFAEKQFPDASLINGGFYVFKREMMEYLSEDAGCVLEKGPLEKLAADDGLRAYHHEGFWQCMDTARDMDHLNEAWARRQAPWKVWPGPYTD